MSSHWHMQLTMHKITISFQRKSNMMCCFFQFGKLILAENDTIVMPWESTQVVLSLLALWFPSCQWCLQQTIFSLQTHWLLFVSKKLTSLICDETFPQAEWQTREKQGMFMIWDNGGCRLSAHVITSSLLALSVCFSQLLLMLSLNESTLCFLLTSVASFELFSPKTGGFSNQITSGSWSMTWPHRSALINC